MMQHGDLRNLERWLVLALLLLGVSGCTRARYRCAADNETYALIGCGAQDPRWRLEDYSITPQPDSRMYDPNNPDRPPMPPDDPTSHELMECVDGMKGWPRWNRNGCTPYVENPSWLRCLPRDANGEIILDRPAALQMALLNSREYQEELETLYLSALDVTFQRFRFDVQFFGSNSTFFTADGPDRAGAGGVSSSLLEEDNSLEMHKLTATGGEFMAGVANSLVWQFAGPDQYTATSLLDFSLVQPLLRAGGRAVVLEDLTDAERALLANIRQMARFRHGFYTQIIAGRSPGAGAARGGLGIGALTPTSGGGTGGIYALLESQVRIRNQRTNVAGLRESLRQFEAFYDAGRIDSLQVEQTRQTLYNAQSTLMALETDYQNQLDAYKLTLGLPPQLEVLIDDPLVKRFDLIDPRTTVAQKTISDLLAKLRDPEIPIAPNDYVTAFDVAPRQCEVVLGIVENDMRSFGRMVASRRAFLRLLAARAELSDGDVDSGLANVTDFENRLSLIHQEYAEQRKQLQSVLKELDTERKQEEVGDQAPLPPEEPRDEGESLDESQDTGPREADESVEMDPRRQRLLEMTERLGESLLAFALTQARCRVESITLVPVELDSTEALEIARRNRLDWMNARAALVDTWRQVEIAANDLRGDMSVTFSGDMGTLGNNPVQFRSTTGQLRVGLQFDPPLTRLAERNLYRESLINYQQARRRYYAYEDRVSQSLRDTLRTIRRYQLDFELRRASVHAAITQVDLTQLKLQKPPEPGGGNVFGATTARDLLTALTSLLDSQNTFLSTWVDYEVQRLNLDFDLGTMRLDAQGNWIDPGPIEPEQSLDGMTPPDEPPPAPLPEEVPLPTPVPLALE